MPPGTLVGYRVTLDTVADFSGGYQHDEWDSLWEEWNCNWRQLWVRDNVEPPTWLISDLAMGEGAKGILFPSTMDPGGTNLVVFIELLGPSDQIEVHDPSDDLPRDQSSWTPVD